MTIRAQNGVGISIEDRRVLLHVGGYLQKMSPGTARWVASQLEQAAARAEKQ